MLRTAVALVVLLSSAATSAWAKPCPAPTVHDLNEDWVGEAGGAYFHLRLGPDGVGVLAIQFLEGRAPSAYYVRSTRIDKRQLAFVLEPASASVEPVFLRGGGCREELNLVVGSRDPNWKWDLSLRPSRVLLERFRATTSAMATLGVEAK